MIRPRRRWLEVRTKKKRMQTHTLSATAATSTFPRLRLPSRSCGRKRIIANVSCCATSNNVTTDCSHTCIHIYWQWTGEIASDGDEQVLLRRGHRRQALWAHRSRPLRRRGPQDNHQFPYSLHWSHSLSLTSIYVSQLKATQIHNILCNQGRKGTVTKDPPSTALSKISWFKEAISPKATYVYTYMYVYM